MRSNIVVLVVLIISTLACGLFSSGGVEENTQLVSTETQVVAGNVEATEIPPEVEPKERVDIPIATETPKVSKKDIPIATKQSHLEPTRVAQSPISDDELTEDYEELSFPYEVAQYQGGVAITVTDLRILQRAYSDRHMLLGVIKNTGTINLYAIMVYVVALDENGVDIHRSNFATGVTDFPVGANNYFAGTTKWEALPEETESLFIYFDGMERWEGTNATQNFEIISEEGRAETDDFWGDVYTFTVSFRNKNENNVRFISIGAILYNKNNRIIGHGHSDREDWVEEGLPPGQKELQPGEIGEISFMCISVYGAVDHYELFVEGIQIFEY